MTHTKVIEYGTRGSRKVRSGTYLSNDDLNDIAERIRTRMRRTIRDIIETGSYLIQVKAALDHGQFTDWIAREFAMSERTARNYMQAAAWAEGKTEMVADLAPQTLYLLASASTPKDIGAEVMEGIKAGHRIDHAELKKRVKNRKTHAAKPEEKNADVIFSVSEAAAMLEVPEKLVHEAQEVLEHGTAEEIAAVEAGKAEVTATAKNIRSRQHKDLVIVGAKRRMDAAIDEAAMILLKLDRADFDQLAELLSVDVLGWHQLAKAIDRARLRSEK